MIKLIVGLGNPGDSYARHRHNVGFMVVDAIADAHRFGPWKVNKGYAITEGQLDHQNVMLLKPLAYMNLSGRAVSEVARFYKWTPEQVLVVHDELDIPPGSLKVKQGGGAGGHNGLRSIDQLFGQNYWRLRVGIGHPGHKDLVEKYVLSSFREEELDWLYPLLNVTAAEIPSFIGKPDPQFAQRALGRLKS